MIIETYLFALNFKGDGTFFLHRHFQEAGTPIDLVFADRDFPIGIPAPTRVYWASAWSTARKAIRMVTNQRVVVAWSFDLGLCLYGASILARKPVGILANNFIFSTTAKGGLGRRVKKWLLGRMFRSGRFHATVNGLALVEQYCRYFNASPECFHVLHDTFDFDLDGTSFEPGGGSVFCGGMNYRDWPTFARCAELAPDLEFVGVANRSRFPLTPDRVPTNLKMHFDLPEDEFYAKMRASSIVCVPLSTDAPAGLIVLGRAALYHKPFLTTKTASTSEFVIDGQSGFLFPPSDAEAIVHCIRRLTENPQERAKVAQAALTKMEEFSPANCARQFIEICRRIERR